MNEIAPGTVLTELALATELDSSQGAVREALLRLDGEGLVTRSGHQGTIVTNLGAAEATEILGLRRRIEGRAATAIVARLGAGEMRQLEALQAAMRQAAADASMWDMISADTEFHLALFRVSGLLAMEPILARCILHTHRFKLWAPWHSRPLIQTADRHTPILDTLRARDARGLRRELETHLDTIVEQRLQK